MSRMEIRHWFYFGFFIRLISVFFSSGFHHWDEHFQIVEFLFVKVQQSPTRDLPWEYAAQIRPWLQVAFYYSLIKPLASFSVHTWVFVMRLASCLLSMAAIWFWFNASKEWLEEKFHKTYAMWINLLWFLPYLSVRHSAENWGASFFALGLAFYLLKVRHRYYIFWSGVFLAFSFWCRFQLGLCFLVFFPFVLYKEKVSRQSLLFMVGFTSGFSLGVLADYWGYGSLVLSPYNYVYQNIVLNKAANYGVMPVYFYLTKFLSRSIFPIGLIILFGFLRFSKLKKDQQWLSFSLLLFLFVHSFIGHKELRFLFPLALFAPLFLVFGFMIQSTWPKRLARPIFALNLVALLYCSFKPAHPAYDFFKVFNLQSFKGDLQVIGEIDPLNLAQVKVNAFNPKQVLSQNILLSELKSGLVFASRKEDFQNIDQKKCSLLYSSLPKFLIEAKVGSFELSPKSQVWSLFECHI